LFFTILQREGGSDFVAFNREGGNRLLQKLVMGLMCQPLDDERAWRSCAGSTGLMIGPDREATFFYREVAPIPF
jgi:hypothetical protein